MLRELDGASRRHVPSGSSRKERARFDEFVNGINYEQLGLLLGLLLSAPAGITPKLRIWAGTDKGMVEYVTEVVRQVVPPSQLPITMSWTESSSPGLGARARGAKTKLEIQVVLKRRHASFESQVRSFGDKLGEHIALRVGDDDDEDLDDLTR